MSNMVLCEQPRALKSNLGYFLPARTADEWFGSLAEARLAVPEVLRRCEEEPDESELTCEQKNLLLDGPITEQVAGTTQKKPDPVKNVQLSRHPSNAEIYGRFFLMFFKAKDHRVEEAKLLDSPNLQNSSKDLSRAKKLIDSWCEARILTRHTGPNGFSYTINFDYYQEAGNVE
ncbi:MAG: hypothetical protein IKE69_08015 [Thermoguttaceae bacterium]|nr:hypothetical protein [Thermoguttaceae bacterium]